jgi:uncharacterized protein with ParB-like and HNH nuclease domain
MINPISKLITEVLSFYSPLNIPNFQRDYKWGKSEAIEFIEDLNYYSNKDSENLYLGNIILSKSPDGKYSIVDGQQRLTTINILLAACRNHAKQLNSSSIAHAIQQKITFTDPIDGTSKGPLICVSESIREPFNELVSENWNGEFTQRVQGRSLKKKINKIKPIYDYFTEVVEPLDQDSLRKFLAAIYNSYVVCIEINDPLEAFSIFERTNGRGIDLEASDLLKNHFFSMQITDIEEKWNEIVENSDTTLLRMLKYFYVSQKGPILKSRLYSEVKNLALEIGHKTLLEKLLEFSRFYHAIRHSSSSDFRDYLQSIDLGKITLNQPQFESIFDAVEGLREFKITQYFPLAYAAIQCFKRNGLNSGSSSNYKTLVKIFESLEKYHFTNNAVCDRVGNEVEKPYADLCVEFSISNNFEESATKLIDLLNQKIATKDEFVSRFTEIKYESGSAGLISYIFDRLTNHNQTTKVSLFQPSSYQRKNNSIEHFYPQKPISGHNELPLADNIGNLLIIANDANGILSNNLPSEKVRMLRNELASKIENNSHVKDFISRFPADCNCEWTDEQISQRATYLANDFFSRILNSGQL